MSMTPLHLLGMSFSSSSLSSILFDGHYHWKGWKKLQFLLAVVSVA
ncbi:hypothetical protein H5410_036191 [Solanum commersonii]|uniref:Uncharacterized protein n=1 Tax=Solanum commersonii TaxID=4109 RepID=A0A9J5Y4Y4_SOLCO|nr:hypothetical protein H5410_036191 [Solanum commersonii]